MTLDEARAAIGHDRKVVYRPYPGAVEEGVITAVRSWRTPTGPVGYVFVRYGGDVGSKATRPEDLEFLA